MITTDDDARLESLLKKSTDYTSILPDELSYLASSFLPSKSAEHHSKAYVILAALCQSVKSKFTVKGKEPNPATEVIANKIAPLIAPLFQDTEEQPLLTGVSFLTALFQVDWESASLIFQGDGALELIMDTVDLTPSLALALQVSQLLGQACGYKSCRTIMSSQSIRWLEAQTRQTKNISLQAAAAMALVKYSKGSASDASEVTGSKKNVSSNTNDHELTDMMRHIVTVSDTQVPPPDAIEGLAYLSVDPAVKEVLASDRAFLKKLFSFVPRRKASASSSSSNILYGVLIVVQNICAYRPQLTEEQAQMQKLRQMANAENSGVTDISSTLDDDDKVKSRIEKLLDVGMLDVLAGAGTGLDSPAVRVHLGKILLYIVNDKENRGLVLQSGGAKILSRIITRGIPSGKLTDVDVAYLEPIQALAKLSITSSPVQVFGPNSGALYDSIRPFSIMIQHPSATLLQRFEGIMALTNLASYSPEASARIAKAEGLLNRVELFLLEEHIMIRRASMELICNLVVGSDEVFERYGSGQASSSKIQLLVALSDVDDLPTRLAACGALATVTISPAACQAVVALQADRHRVFPILAQVIDPSVANSSNDTIPREQPNPGLVHRGVTCIRNILCHVQSRDVQIQMYQEAKESGLVTAVTNTVQNSPSTEILEPSLDILQWLSKAQNKSVP